jgi:hypothetical protein
MVSVDDDELKQQYPVVQVTPVGTLRGATPEDEEQQPEVTPPSTHTPPVHPM